MILTARQILGPCILLGVALLSMGCSDSSDRPSTPPPPSMAALSIEPPIALLDIGNNEAFLAVATYSDGTVMEVSDQVSWSLEFDTGVIEGSTEPENSNRYRATALMGGQDNILAMLDAFTASATVDVVEAELIELVVTPGSVEVLKGYTHPLMAEGVYDDGHQEDLTEESDWASDNEAVAPVDDDGLVTGRSGGSANITASLGGVSGTSIVNVREEPEIEFIEVRPPEATIYLDGYRQFNAYAHYSDGRVQPVTKSALWISSDTSVTAQDHRNKGQFNSISAGTAQVTAELGLGNVGTANVTVEEVVVTHIITTPRNATVEVATSRRYYTEAQTSDGKQFSVNQSPDQHYTVADPSIAHISNFESDAGKLTGLIEGTTTITSTYVHEGEEFTDQVPVTICKGDSC